jgi:hypothetical protein
MKSKNIQNSVGRTIAVLLIAVVAFCGYAANKEIKRVLRPLKTYLLHPLLRETPQTLEIVSLLKVYQASKEKQPIELRRIGKMNDGGYVVPEIAIQKADAVLGYGISDDISFEEDASTLYNKPSWGFDGTCPPITTQNPLCHFIPLCIGNQKREDYATFDEQLEMLDLKDKQLFIKMDIEGAEYDVLPDILNHSNNITGIVLEIHFWDQSAIHQALTLLKMLKEEFLLIHVHGNNMCQDCFVTQNSTGKLTRVLELTYINKNYIDDYSLALDQTHPTPLDMPNSPNLPDVRFAIL